MFEMSNDGFVQVYTDGACSFNGIRGAQAGIGVFWGDNHPLNVSEPVNGRPTNNTGEIQAATRAIRLADRHGIHKLVINTDSKFLIRAATEWMPIWTNNGWRCASGEPVKNKKDFKDLDYALSYSNVQVRWRHVWSHQGIYGNEMADQLARAGATRYKTY